MLDRSRGAHHPGIGCRQKADDRREQQAGNQRLRSADLHEVVEITVKSVSANVSMNSVQNDPLPPDGPPAPKCSIVFTVRSKTARIREDMARLWRNSCGKGWALAAAPESPGEEYEEYEKYTDQHHVGGGESTALDLLRTLGPALSQNHFSGSGRCCRPR
jgi:hypothetical protein